MLLCRIFIALLHLTFPTTEFVFDALEFLNEMLVDSFVVFIWSLLFIETLSALLILGITLFFYYL
jgi:hypothetical protein